MDGEENKEKALPNESTENTETPQTTPQQKEEGGIVQRVRTYKEDLARAIQNQKASLTSVTAAEERRRTRLPKDMGGETSHLDVKKIVLVGLSVLLLLVGVGVISYFLFIYEGEKEVAVEQEVPSLIFSEEQQEIDITNTQPRNVLQKLWQARVGVSLPLSEVMHFYITEKQTPTSTATLLTARAFLESIDASVDDSFLRSLRDDFMFGVHVFNQNQPFLIFISNSYQNSFAGMLEWENAIYSDLFLFMKRNVTEENVDSSDLFTKSFIDKVVRNIDARVLTNEEGDIELLYAFPNQQMLIITTNENTLVEIITRMNTVRVF